jgi:hypothetical protein
MREDLFQRLLRRRAANIGIGAGAQPPGHFRAHLDAPFSARMRERLRVRIGDNEFDPFESHIDHVVDRIASGAADADDRDPRLELVLSDRSRYGKVDAHKGLRCRRW